jgi:hypothetical protein
MFLSALPVFAAVLAVAATVLADNHRPSNIPITWVAPEGVIRVSACVPLMGEHWANPADLPLGPIYTVHNGRLTSVEYMIAQADFLAGRSWDDLKTLYWGREVPIQNVNIGFVPMGHEGYEVPHYDLHFYTITDPEVRAITC